MKKLTLLATGVLLLFWGDFKPNPIPKPRHKYIVVAHRGDHTVYPENSLQGYAAAIKDGADYIEIDLRTTADGQLISLHDGTVNRMTDGKGAIKDMTLQQVEQLKLHSKIKDDTTTYHIPKFEEVLKLCKDKIYIYIDFKEADASQTLKMLQQYGMQKQVLVYINKPSQYTDWRKTDSTMPLMLSTPDSAKDVPAMEQFINHYHPDVLDGNYTTYSETMLKFAAKLNIPVWPDVQSPAEGPQVWDKAIGIGLKGVQTDNPPALIRYLEQKGLR